MDQRLESEQDQQASQARGRSGPEMEPVDRPGAILEARPPSVTTDAAPAGGDGAHVGATADANALLGAALESMAQGILIVDADFKISALNERVWDFVPEYRELYQIGADIRDAWRESAKAGRYDIGSDEAEDLVARWTSVFLRRERLVTERITTDGKLIQIDLQPAGSYAGWVATYTDLSERRKTEAALVQSADNLRTILENVADGLFALDEAGTVQLFNVKAEEIFGFSADEIIGQSASLLVPDAIAAKYAATIRAFLSTDRSGAVDISGESVGRRKDGSEFPLGIGVGYVPQGEKHTFIASVRDIGEAKAAAERVQHGKRLESLGQLVGGIAHEFNNLLTSISGFTEMALKKAGDEKRVVEYLTEVADVSKRAVTLTGQMLAFGRKQIVEKEVVRVGQTLLSQESLIRVSLDASTELSFEIDEDDSHIEIDSGQLSQCVMNLVNNARHAMPDGGKLFIRYMTVDVEADKETSHGKTLPAGRYALISVSDTGTGMGQEVLARLFDPFYSTKEKGKGTGLGLSLVYGMIANSDGVIDVTTEVGVGSTFSIYLPVVEADSAGAAAGVLGAPAAEAVLRIPVLLVVDDDAHVRRFTQVTLEDEGYQVLVARDGEEAVARHKAQDGGIDLLVSDVVMPRMGGVELATVLTDAQPGLKVVFMSGYTAETSQKVNDFTTDGNFLQKPFQSEDLIYLVSKIVRPPEAGETEPPNTQPPETGLSEPAP
ncbi:MAG TPA: PAS domain S-box protein [Alphaproteobacteria bacterium]|nr:PAS domain S-box protein [Alphaproteobacteria bacterium]